MKRKYVLILIILGIAGILTSYRLPAVEAVTWVEGHITSDTTWTVADSPYVVTNDVIVDANVTLTIEPGVEVRFGGDFSLIIRGSMYAVGTDSNLITFTSNKLEPMVGDWDSMKFIGEQDESFTTRYCVVKYAKNGITLEGLGKAVIEKSEVSNNSASGVYLVGGNIILKENTIRHNQRGISAGGVPFRTIIINNSIIHNSNVGLDIPNSNVTVSGNVVSFNEWYGIDFYGEGDISNMVIAENIVQDNGDVGVRLVTLDGDIWNITVFGNFVSSNQGSGIYLDCINYPDDIFNVNISGNTVTQNGWYGIAVNGDDDIFNVTISRNIVSSNGRLGLYVGRSNDIFNVTLSENTVYSNGFSGIAVYAEQYMFDVIISGNTVYMNLENGICIDNWGHTYNVTLLHNLVHSNQDDGIYLDILRSKPGYYTFLYLNNISNNNIGINIYRTHTISLNNSISYNSYGIFYELSSNNLAHYNDIYSNSYGMYVHETHLCLVNAEYNYWGDASGPYHVSLNPSGRGNSVNGDGIDLDFIPFLTSPVGTINHRPVAILEVDKTNPNVDETVTFDASGSTDDGKIDYYFFDFGDGTHSGWTPLSVVTHKYTEEGVYNTTLIVMDDFGVTSLDSGLVYVEILVIPEFPPFLILPIFMTVTLLVAILSKRIQTSSKMK